jgi:hypothetical protein
MSPAASAGVNVTMSGLASLMPLYSVRGVGVRQVRLVCGLLLFGYWLSHYVNHALGQHFAATNSV